MYILSSQKLVKEKRDFMSRKGENIFYRKDGRWEARYIKEQLMDGSYRYGYVYGKSYLDAKNKRNRVLLHLEEIRKRDRNNKNILNYYIYRWLSSMRFMVKESTYALYYRIVSNHISPDLGNMRISFITSEVIESYINQKFEVGRIDGGGGLSNKTIRDIVVVLRQILSYANIHVQFKLPKLKKREIQILKKAEQKKIEQRALEINDTYSLGIIISLYTGMRLGEICALTWKDINLKKKVICVNKTMNRIQNVDQNSSKRTKVIIDYPKTEYSIREIPINKFLYSILQKNVKDKDIYVLTGMTKYIEPRNYYKKYKALLRSVGCKGYGFHTLRHTFATRCIEIGMDPKTLSEILGHSDVKVTLSLYVHPNNKLKNKYIEKLNPTY